MKCEVIRDLLPSYIDGLTSKGSNELIEEHLKKCDECVSYLEEIRKDVGVEKISFDNEIEPFIKIKQKTAKTVLYAVIITAMISAFVYDAWYSYVHNGKSISSEEVEIKLEESEGVQMLEFEPVNEDVIITVGYTDNMEVDGKTAVKTLNLIKRKKHHKYYPVSDNKYMYMFWDNDTMLDLFSYPEIRDFSEEDFFVIDFDDGAKIIKLSDLRDGKLILIDAENKK